MSFSYLINTSDKNQKAKYTNNRMTLCLNRPWTFSHETWHFISLEQVPVKSYHIQFIPITSFLGEPVFSLYTKNKNTGKKQQSPCKYPRLGHTKCWSPSGTPTVLSRYTPQWLPCHHCTCKRRSGCKSSRCMLPWPVGY